MAVSDNKQNADFRVDQGKEIVSISTRNGEESFNREVGEWMNEWNVYLSLEHN